VEQQSTVENVLVEWPTAVQVDTIVIVTPMKPHGGKTVDTWLTRIRCLSLSWDLEIPGYHTVLMRKDTTHWGNCDVGIRAKVFFEITWQHFLAPHIECLLHCKEFTGNIV
jgi:alkylated DNA repair dioxygenase AlkB